MQLPKKLRTHPSPKPSTTTDLAIYFYKFHHEKRAVCASSVPSAGTFFPGKDVIQKWRLKYPEAKGRFFISIWGNEYRLN
jgi:hypothetical protein